MMRYHDLGFQAACEQLVHGDLPRTNVRLHKTPTPEPISEPPDAAWQKSAKRIAEQAADFLWQPQGRRALDYLRNKRGLTDEIVLAAQLGYIVGKPHEWIERDGIKIPCGITIPWYADGAIWGIKVRRSAGEQRYQQASGGNLRGCLYRADQIRPGLPLMLTEGEFDTLTAWQLSHGRLSVASMGSASHRHINPRWYRKLIVVPSLLICMDVDEAGQNAAAEIKTLSRAAKRIHVPVGKDINEFYLRAGKPLATEWLKQIAEYRT
jgi:DNA primase